MSEPSHVFLIPGFFGFTSIGDVSYFSHVADYLRTRFAADGSPARVHVVKTRPTASFRLRSARVLEAMETEAGSTRGIIHLVGHSSGGIDARIVLAPGTVTATGVVPEELLERVRSVVTVATPHYGTPLAGMFDSSLGRRLLALFSLSSMNAIRFGRVPIAAFFKLAGIFAKLDDLGPANSSLLDQLFTQLLDDFSPDRSREIQDFFRDVGEDQSLIGELAPDAMFALNAATPDRPGVRYGCVTTMARAPGIGTAFAAGLDPSAHAMHALYNAVYRVTAMMPKERLPVIQGPSAQVFLNAYGALPFSDDNDGVVPTLSQLHGELIAAAKGDHHDVIGHFNDPQHIPPHYDWLATGTGFNREGFVTLWSRVATFLLNSEAGPVSP